jgi:hypothetical protein
MQCPVCDVTLSISSREGIEIDFCPQCRGVWLDRGELDKIIERAGPSVGGRGYDEHRRSEPRYEEPRRDDRDDRDDRDRYERERYDPRKKRRRSLLEDLFDFD